MEWKSDSNHPSKSSKRMGGGGGFQAPGKVLLLDLVLITQVGPHCENTSPTREKTDKRQMKVEPEHRRALSSRPRDLALVPCHKSATKGTFFKIIVGSYAIVRNGRNPLHPPPVSPSGYILCNYRQYHKYKINHWYHPPALFRLHLFHLYSRVCVHVCVKFYVPLLQG